MTAHRSAHATIGFRRLAADDLPALYLWLAKPHVAKWYAPAPSSYAEVVARYGPRTIDGNAVRSHIVMRDGTAIGYAQHYDVREFPDFARALDGGDGIAAMDLLIGEEALVGKGLGPRLIRRYAEEVVFEDRSIGACVAGAPEGHAAGIRAFEKAGFRRWKSMHLDGAPPECVLRLERVASDIRIAPIDLAHDLDRCIAFRREGYVASFGSEDGMEEEMGPSGERYVERLRARIAEVPEGNMHLWHGSRIVGQTEMRLVAGEPEVGYVSFYYVLPELRGRGLGRRLHEHAVAVFRRRGMRKLRLSVALRNEDALAFYRRLGWITAGTRPHRVEMAIMECPIDPRT